MQIVWVWKSKYYLEWCLILKSPVLLPITCYWILDLSLYYLRTIKKPSDNQVVEAFMKCIHSWQFKSVWTAMGVRCCLFVSRTSRFTWLKRFLYLWDLALTHIEKNIIGMNSVQLTPETRARFKSTIHKYLVCGG